MKLELTQRDILLLKLACSAVIAFFMIRFLLMPGLERFQENSIQNDILQETVDDMEETIEKIPVLEKAIESGLEELAEASAPYYERMENRQVDELLTGLALKHGLFPVSLTIDDAKASLPEPYLYSVKASQAAADDPSAGSESVSGGEGDGESAEGSNEQGAVSGENTSGEPASGNPDGVGSVFSGGYMKTAAGHMVLRGEEAMLFAFLGDVEENYPAIRVCSVGIEEGVYFDADWNRVEQSDMSCELEIYMYDRSAVE